MKYFAAEYDPGNKDLGGSEKKREQQDRRYEKGQEK